MTHKVRLSIKKAGMGSFLSWCSIRRGCYKGIGCGAEVYKVFLLALKQF